MNYTKFNPVIRSASLYEKINRTDECVGYDCRVIYMISGDLTAVVGEEKFSHLSSGNLLYIPAGTPYKLKSKYLRAVAVTFDLTDDEAAPEEKICVNLISGSSPCVITPEDGSEKFLYMILPVRLRAGE